MILADKTTNVSWVEQFSLYIRYFDADVTKIRENSLQFVPVHSTTGLELAKKPYVHWVLYILTVSPIV